MAAALAVLATVPQKPVGLRTKRGLTTSVKIRSISAPGKVTSTSKYGLHQCSATPTLAREVRFTGNLLKFLSFLVHLVRGQYYGQPCGCWIVFHCMCHYTLAEYDTGCLGCIQEAVYCSYQKTLLYIIAGGSSTSGQHRYPCRAV